MATTKKQGSALKNELEKALTKALKDVSGGSVNPETQKPYTLTDKAKVWDRVLKLEAIKVKMNEGQWAEGFSNDDE